ncbi:MAG: isoprenylcysteine carboxylmethyltransferase family protein [Acidobacteria bacterium]|nr:MAG: isoprenylcysteine carboxylmethyltransferase family protein [Acidobacteriota bacterium]REK02875.1 MAG: isoprenylcysteine carboxylmethyltransferase family protein [Acidobacteriota bacterium]REK13321.1 MAG: isoprenylcysteine carboxylmethyltransferase family protein [Acidobacteriota bacterium]REK41315.1 MAG: isoprenylcysteine carboxylmethyltransferase family protein [Acidobacteriota bacterium]
MTAKRSTSILQRIRVPLGFAFGILFVLFAAPNWISLGTGIAVAFLGLLIRAWSTGHIRKNVEVSMSGPYSRTRNPLYLGSFIMGLGFSIASGRWWLILAFAGFYLGIYLPVMRIEARELTSKFGDDYTRYAENVPLFFPRLAAYGEADAEFSKDLYLKYKEYQAAIGFVLVSLILVLKLYLLEYWR